MVGAFALPLIAISTPCPAAGLNTSYSRLLRCGANPLRDLGFGRQTAFSSAGDICSSTAQAGQLRGKSFSGSCDDDDLFWDCVPFPDCLDALDASGAHHHFCPILHLCRVHDCSHLGHPFHLFATGVDGDDDA